MANSSTWEKFKGGLLCFRSDVDRLESAAIRVPASHGNWARVSIEPSDNHIDIAFLKLQKQSIDKTKLYFIAHSTYTQCIFLEYVSALVGGFKPTYQWFIKTEGLKFYVIYITLLD